MVQSTSLLDMRRSHSCLYISSFQPWLPWDTPGESWMLISLGRGQLASGRGTGLALLRVNVTLPGNSNAWWGLRSTALNCASFAPKFFRLWRMSGLKPLHPIQTANLPQALASPAGSVLIPGSGPVISICKARLRCSRAAEMAQHSHLGYWSHPTLVALTLTNLIPPSLLEYLLCLSHSCPENMPGVSSPGPASVSSVPFPLPLLSCPPASSESLLWGLYSFSHPLGHLPLLTKYSWGFKLIPFPSPRFSRSLVPPAWLLSAHALPPPPSAWPTFPLLVLNLPCLIHIRGPQAQAPLT